MELNNTIYNDKIYNSLNFIEGKEISLIQSKDNFKILSNGNRGVYNNSTLGATFGSGTRHVITIPNTYQFLVPIINISFTAADQAATPLYNNIDCRLIDELEIKFGNQVIKYTRETLQKLIQLNYTNERASFGSFTRMRIKKTAADARGLFMTSIPLLHIENLEDYLIPNYALESGLQITLKRTLDNYFKGGGPVGIQDVKFSMDYYNYNPDQTSKLGKKLTFSWYKYETQLITSAVAAGGSTIKVTNLEYNTPIVGFLFKLRGVAHGAATGDLELSLADLNLSNCLNSVEINNGTQLYLDETFYNDDDRYFFHAEGGMLSFDKPHVLTQGFINKKPEIDLKLRFDAAVAANRLIVTVIYSRVLVFENNLVKFK